jgi:anti-anti-sigma factor
VTESSGDAGWEWDGHLLLRFRDERHRQASVAAWVQRGLTRGEKVLCTSPPGDTSLLTSLAQRGVDVARATGEGRLRVMRIDEFYPEDGQRQLVVSALDEGFPGVRLSAQANAALSFLSRSRHEQVESVMNGLCTSLPASAMCQYAARRTVGDSLASAVEHHPEGVRDDHARLRRRGDRLHLAGDLDVTSAELVRLGLERAARDQTESCLTIDLSELGFIDVEGCRALVLGTDTFRTAGGTVFLQDAQPRVRRAMTLLGVERQDRVRFRQNDGC